MVLADDAYSGRPIRMLWMLARALARPASPWVWGPTACLSIRE